VVVDEGSLSGGHYISSRSRSRSRSSSSNSSSSTSTTSSIANTPALSCVQLPLRPSRGGCTRGVSLWGPLHCIRAHTLHLPRKTTQALTQTHPSCLFCSCRYTLVGVVVHEGSLSGGHFISRSSCCCCYNSSSSYSSNSNTHPLLFCSCRYALVGVVVHEGSLSGGHYIAYVRTAVDPTRWHHFSDTQVTEATEGSVLAAQAFLLFYERVHE